MFRKSFKIKSNSRLKTTEKKKLRNELVKEFPIMENFFSLDALNLKSNISVVDIVTGSGESVKVFTAPLYPSFILYNGKYFPTVYILWEVPFLVHHFTTYPPVLDKIKNGADLMLPGVVTEEPCSLSSFGKLKKGDSVGVNTTGNLISFAVGEAAMSSTDMYNSGKRGKCVNIVHIFGDYLTELAPTILEPPLKPLGNNILCDSTESTNSGDLEIIEDNLKDELKVSEEVDINSDISNSSNNDLINIDNKVPLMNDATCDVEPSQCMEDMLRYCFFKSLVTSAKKTPLPLLTNVFYKVHMMTVYPQGSLLDIKKSKYKKLSTFLEEMYDIKVIDLERNSNGIHKITAIDFGHELIKEFLKANPQESSNNAKKSSNVKGPCISETYSVNASVLPLFSKFGYKKGDNVNQTDVRRIITSYIRDMNLQDLTDKRFIKPDKLLKEVVKMDVNSLTWEDIMSSVIKTMGQSYQVNLPTNKTFSGKGKMPLIEIVVASRAGNKKVTLVNNLTFFGINLNDFSKECQHGVAASTTINSLPHLKAEQVQIQGNQTVFVGKLLLEKYQVPKRFIRGLP